MILSTFLVYKLTFKNSANNKVYIGYTGKGVLGRLRQHRDNMLRGLDTKLYRAMRLYGIENVVYEVLEDDLTKDEAIHVEKDYISQYNSFKNGYNMTLGGDGGDVVNCMSREKFNKWKQQRRELSAGFANGNCTGVLDEVIVEHACKIVQRDGYLSRGNYKQYARQNKEYNLPHNIGPTFRFNGEGFEGMLISVAARLGIDVETLRYDKLKNPAHIEKIRKKSKEYLWVTKDSVTKRVHISSLSEYTDNGWTRGR